MPQYVVLSDTELPDATGRYRLRIAGDTVTLSADQARYLLLAGQIGAAGTTAPAPAPYQSGDVVVIRRGGAERVLALSELPAFFATVMGADPTPANALLDADGSVLLDADDTPLLDAA